MHHTPAYAYSFYFHVTYKIGVTYAFFNYIKNKLYHLYHNSSNKLLARVNISVNMARKFAESEKRKMNYCCC